MNGRYGKMEHLIEGVVEFSDCIDSIRYLDKRVTRFLLKGDKRTYYFYSETRELELGMKVKLSVGDFTLERVTVDSVEFSDRNHKLEVLK
ncbi:MAG: hypothetical protein AABY03_00320 [Nanoarchaeota archaeon]